MKQVARLALGLELGEHVEDRRLHRDVERARRLVAHDDARVAGEGPGDRDALLQAAGELARLEVEVALREPQVRRQACRPARRRPCPRPGELADRARQDAAHASSCGSAPSRGSGTPSASRACRRSAAARDARRAAWPSSATVATGVRPPRCRGSSWPASTCPSRTRRRARASRPRPAARSTPTSAGTSWPPLLERLRDALAARARQVVVPIGAWTDRRVGGSSDLARSGRSDGSASTGRSPTSTTGGTTVAAEVGRRAGSGRRTRRSAGARRSAAACPGSWPAPARSCARRGAAAHAADRPCTGAAGRSKTSTAAPSSTILPAYMTPTRSHIERMTPRLWAISRTADVGLGDAAHGRDRAPRLDGGVEAGRRLVEHEQLAGRRRAPSR